MGLFLVDSPEQRRLRVRDSADLALSEWLGSAAFDRDEDFWPPQWAEAYVHVAAGEATTAQVATDEFNLSAQVVVGGKPWPRPPRLAAGLG